MVPAPQYKKIFPDAEASVLGVMFGSTSLAHVLYHSFQFLKVSTVVKKLKLKCSHYVCVHSCALINAQQDLFESLL